jgi:hypothetical protein
MPNIQLQMSQGRLFAFLLPFNVRTLGFTLPEALTQRKSKRPVEGLVCIVLVRPTWALVYGIQVPCAR